MRAPIASVDQPQTQDMANPNDDMRAAVAAHQRGDLKTAEHLYAKVLAQAPSYTPARCYLGIALLQQGRPAEAVAPLAIAVQTQPTFEALAHYGLALAMSGEPVKALSHIDRALQLNPNDPAALRNRGNVLKLLDRRDEALDTFDRAIALAPNDAELRSNRGTVLADLGRYEDAVQSYDRALAIQPRNVDALENRGNALTWLNRLDEAFETFKRGLAVQPEAADLHFAYANALLRDGDYRNGFREYEWRLRQPANLSRRRWTPGADWRGESSLAGKTILLHSEQGFGDTLNFVRYVPLVAATAGRVLLRVQGPLRTLLGAQGWDASIIGDDARDPDIDCNCPLPSLPLAFATELDNIPAATGYLKAPAERIEHWRHRIPPGRPRIGIVWCGNPTFANDRLRSMNFTQVAPLLQMSDVNFFSLNPGLDTAVVSALEAMPNVHHLAAGFADFADTAAAIASLDLVVTTDTAMAHLVGAMGRPVWIMLATGADWRWFTGRDDNPWYASARLFRQPSFGNWPAVIDRIGRALREFIVPDAGQKNAPGR